MIQIQQAHWHPGSGWSDLPERAPDSAHTLALVFGARKELEQANALEELIASLPGALVMGCSTAGEIRGTETSDGGIVATAASFTTTRFESARVLLADHQDSREAGQALIAQLPAAGLRHVLVLSDGQAVNGSQLVKGIQEALPEGVKATGGLAGDAESFERTVIVDGGESFSEAVAAVGFYGDDLRVGYGSLGGWDPFGPERLVTRSDGNVLYELDGQPALDLYRKYLGPYSDDLRQNSFLFPLGVRPANGGDGVVRTVLSIDERADSMTFAGDMPEGHYARLMKANFDRLIGGAELAAEHSSAGLEGKSAELALLISCVGRRIVLRQRTEEELEGVRRVLGPHAALAGFYSYGEISPFSHDTTCRLHNQTMTITTFSES